jgi:hypothetical protein
MIFISNFNQNLYISVAKPKNIVVFAYKMCQEVMRWFMVISVWIYILLTAMKRGVEGRQWSVKRFIASILHSILQQIYTQR